MSEEGKINSFNFSNFTLNRLWKMWFYNIRKLPFVTSSNPLASTTTPKIPKTNSRFYADSPIASSQGLQLQVPNLDKVKSSSDIDLARASALASMTPPELEVKSLTLRSNEKEPGLNILLALTV